MRLVSDSISRAYYAAFHGAHDYCESAGKATVRNNAPVEVRRCLESTGQDLIAADLRRLHIWTKHADYDVLAPLEDFPEVARSALAMAESILDRLNTLTV